MFSFSKLCVYLPVVYFASTFSDFDLVFRETKDENSNDIWGRPTFDHFAADVT